VFQFVADRTRTVRTFYRLSDFPATVSFVSSALPGDLARSMSRGSRRANRPPPNPALTRIVPGRYFQPFQVGPGDGGVWLATSSAAEVRKTAADIHAFEEAGVSPHPR
jgi:hypothetical protein